jgi:hypothetical protein
MTARAHGRPTLLVDRLVSGLDPARALVALCARAGLEVDVVQRLAERSDG